MKLFVTGGTGVLGRPVVARLVTQGFRVRALAHSDAARSRLAAAGAEPVPGSLFDPGSMATAMHDVDAVLHLATRIPPMFAASRRRAWSENDRIRREGTRTLVDLALDADVPTFVYPGVVFVYGDGGGEWLDAARTKPATPAAAILESTLHAESEVARFTAGRRRGIVLRMGTLLGPDPFCELLLKAARHGFALVPGDGEGYMASVWTEDACDAIVAALAPTVAASTYDVVDDEPLRRREWVAALALAAGRPTLRTLPTWLFKLTGGVLPPVALPSRRVANRRFKDAAGWAPKMSSARGAFARLAALGGR